MLPWVPRINKAHCSKAALRSWARWRSSARRNLVFLISRLTEVHCWLYPLWIGLPLSAGHYVHLRARKPLYLSLLGNLEDVPHQQQQQGPSVTVANGPLGAAERCFIPSGDDLEYWEGNIAGGLVTPS